MTFKQFLTWAGVFLVVIVLAIAVMFLIAAGALTKSTTQALQPFNEASRSLATQVSSILHPTPTILPDPVTIIHDIRALSRLETVQYSMEKVITAETGGGAFEFLFGDKLLFVAHGRVIAGVDLEKLTPEDFRVESGVLFVNLPEAEVFETVVDNDLSYVYDRQRGILTRGDVQLESQARVVAEQEILKAALADGILDWAQKNAESALSILFRNIGYVDVIYE
jgi:hypothetical protein